MTLNILKIFEPTMLPTAISVSFFKAAEIEAASSGKLVPKATIVTPIIRSLTPHEKAILEAPSIKNLAPIANPTDERTINIADTRILCVFPSGSST